MKNDGTPLFIELNRLKEIVFLIQSIVKSVKVENTMETFCGPYNFTTKTTENYNGTVILGNVPDIPKSKNFITFSTKSFDKVFL